MKSNSKRGYMLLMFLGFASYMGIFSQIVPYLQKLGFSAVERGVVLAISALISIVMQFVVGYLSDVYGTAKKFFIILTVLFGVSALMTYSFTGSFMFYFLVTVVSSGAVRTTSNFLETWVLEVDGMYEDFGLIRAAGSLGWAITSIIMGYVVQHYGYSWLGIVSFGLSILVLGISFYMDDANKTQKLDVKMSDVKVLFNSKRFLVLIFVFLITYIVHNADSITVIDYMLEIGGNEFTIGTKNFVLALVEIPMLYYAGRLLTKHKASKLMIFASVVQCFKFVMYSFVKDPNMIVVVGMLQAVTFPFILVTQKDMVYQEVPDHLRTTGQLVSIALTISLSAVITPLLSGLLIEYLSTSQVIFWLGISMLIPAFIMLKYDKIP